MMNSEQFVDVHQDTNQKYVEMLFLDVKTLMLLFLRSLLPNEELNKITLPFYFL